MCFSPDIAAIVDKVKQQHLSYTAATPHLALSCTKLHIQSTNMLSICLLLDVFQIEGCSAGQNVDATFCMLIQGDGWTSKGGQVMSGMPLI